MATAHPPRDTVQIDKDTLITLCQEGVGESFEDEQGRTWVVVEDNPYDNSRWSLIDRLIIAEVGTERYFSFLYEHAAGESNIDFWGEFGNTIELREVFAKVVTVTTWQ